MINEQNPFDPATNPAVEFVPYHEDPGIQHIVADQEKHFSRETGQLLNVWLAAKHELTVKPGSEAAIESLANAERNFDGFLAQAGLRRAVRLKKPPEQ